MFGMNIDPHNAGGRGNPTAQDLQPLGVQIVRYEFKHNAPPDPMTFYRQWAEHFAGYGIRSLVLIDYNSRPIESRPAADATDEEWNRYTNELRDIARQVAQTFPGGMTAIEVWNEPDERLELNRFGIPEVRFGQILKALFDAIKAVDPRIKVVSGGLAKGDPTWMARVLNTLDGPLPFDALGVHPYVQQAERGWPDPTFGVGPGHVGSYVGDLLMRYRNIVELRNTPIWLTEAGYDAKGNDPEPGFAGNRKEFQAEYLRRFFRSIQRDSPFVEEVLWFCYSDGMGIAHPDPALSERYGVIDRDGGHNPSYQAYQQVAGVV